MLKVLYTKIKGSLLADIAPTLTLLPVSLSVLSTVQTSVNFAGGEWTYLNLSNGVYSEEVKITGVSGAYLIAERGKSGSIPRAFSAMDTVVTDVLGVDGIKDTVAGTVSPSSVSVIGSGLAYVTNIGQQYNVHVDAPTFVGENGITVLGAWPNLRIAAELGLGGCSPGEGTGGAGTGVSSLVIDSTILQGSIVGSILNLTLQTPIFAGAGGTAVTGTWPNFTITSAGGGGSVGVSSVGVAAGLTLTGSPTSNPVLAITNTGVTPGDYSGFVVNARGQITQMPVGFNPISSIVMPSATVSRVGGEITLAMHAADVGVPGIVALADETAALNPADASSAVSPALLHNVLNTTSGSSAAGTGTGEADATYTNPVTSTDLTLTLAAGEIAMLIGQVQVLNDSTPLTPVAFGISVFDAAGNRKYASKICTQSLQAIAGQIIGPFTGTLHIVTTALPSGSTLQSAHLAAIKL